MALKVLIASKNNQHFNPFIAELTQEFEKTVEVVWDIQAFWERKDCFDIVHIHWPEYLQRDSGVDLPLLKEALSYWQQRSVMIATMHNMQPHDKGFDHKYPGFYQLVYQYIDAVVHLGSYSINQFHDYFPGLYPKHKLIEHHVYRIDIEKALSPPLRNFQEVNILVFGKIRDDRERALLRQLLRKKSATWKVEITNWMAPFRIGKKKHFFKWLRYLWIKTWDNVLFGKSISSGHLPKEAVADKFNQATLVLIPRLDTLNSGVVYQSFAYGKVVVGPAIGNIQTALERIQNPTYDAGDVSSMIDAINKGIDLARNGKGTDNREYALKALHPNIKAAEYLNFYQEMYDLKYGNGQVRPD